MLRLIRLPGGYIRFRNSPVSEGQRGMRGSFQWCLFPLPLLLAASAALLKRVQEFAVASVGILLTDGVSSRLWQSPPYLAAKLLIWGRSYGAYQAAVEYPPGSL